MLVEWKRHLKNHCCRRNRLLFPELSAKFAAPATFFLPSAAQTFFPVHICLQILFAHADTNGHHNSKFYPSPNSYSTMGHF